MEHWRKIPTFPLYAASTWGRIRRDEPGSGTYAGYIVGIYAHKDTGYQICRIVCSERKRGITCTVHRLIALTFLPNPDGLPEVDHLDHDKTNNNVVNLRWISTAANHRRSSSKPIYLEDIVLGEITFHQTISDAANHTGHHPQNIGKALQRGGSFGRGRWWPTTADSDPRRLL